GQKHVAMSARALCSPHFTKYPSEVWQFMRYFAFNPNAAKLIVTTGDVPVVKSVAMSDTYIQPQVIGGAKGAFARGIDYAISSSIRQYPPGIDNAAFQKPYQDAQKAILAGTEGIDDGARTSQDQMQRLADTFWAKAGQ